MKVFRIFRQFSSNHSNPIKNKNPQVFFDISVDGSPSGRMVFEVFLFQIYFLTIIKHSYIPIKFPKLLKTSEDYASEMQNQPPQVSLYLTKVVHSIE